MNNESELYTTDSCTESVVKLLNRIEVELTNELVEIMPFKEASNLSHKFVAKGRALREISKQ